MANFQILFNGETTPDKSAAHVQATFAHEMGIDARKIKQLFSGRTVVLRSHLSEHEAHAWQKRLAAWGAVTRIKALQESKGEKTYWDAERTQHNKVLNDLTAAHLECPRCGHMQLDASHCSRCGIDLEQAIKARRQQDNLLEKRARIEAERNNPPAPPPPATAVPEPEAIPEPGKKKRRWFGR